MAIPIKYLADFEVMCNPVRPASIITEQFKIKTYGGLADLYKASGFDRQPAFEDFDIFTFADTYPSIKNMFPPHRRNFFTTLFFENQQDGHLQINDSKHQKLVNCLLFQSPEHIFSFVRGDKMKGYIILFHSSFLLPTITEVLNDYSFFSSLNNNLFHLNKKEKDEFRLLAKILIKEQNARKQSKPAIKYLLLTFLEKCNALQTKYQSEEKYIPKSFQLVKQFQQLINNNFLEHKTVEQYAKFLNITPNHLNETIKNQTGKTAKQHITERILLEAKNLLLYSEMDIAEISYFLDFSEPSHFGKFFKKETGLTPSRFRQNP